ncbi:16S rRNA (adenine(1518)-N(6)/adenine(1519)-N(6))-dimethyltransferase RsmA, partial [Akkermansia sp.]
MKPSEIRNVLEDHEVRPSKSLGQNFLTDENVARWIVGQLEIQPQDCVVEVGPGTGALTEHAAPLCRKLILVEFDSRLAEYQKERWAGDPHVEVHHADGASWDPRGLFAEAPVKFLGNLPYSAGGAILQNFLSRPSAVERAVVMLQKEFIDRILATPDDDAFGLLSLRIQKNWIPRALKTIPPEAFHPRPRIDSTVMLLTPRPVRDLPPYDDRLMDELMRKAFSQ